MVTKVWGTTLTPNPAWGADTRQVRVIVAAERQVDAVALLAAAGLGRITQGQFRGYWSRTSNPTEIAVADHHAVWWANEHGRNSPSDYHEVTHVPSIHQRS